MPTATTTIITQPGPVYLNVVFRESPVSMVCPHCQAHVVTATNYEDGTVTWIAAGGLCLLGYVI
jgi:lipopolysaccharide-induced tumor necrosis factor-alpha factor